MKIATVEVFKLASLFNHLTHAKVLLELWSSTLLRCMVMKVSLFGCVSTDSKMEVGGIGVHYYKWSPLLFDELCI